MRDEPVSHGRGGGFTLTELVVCLGVMILLASILLPAFARARSDASHAPCLARIHQRSP